MNHWNKLTDIFGCTWKEGDIPECAADSICIAWPSIVNGIKESFHDPSNFKALDFGCGGGLFCRELNKIGFETTGFDKSEELVKAANSNNPDEVVISCSNKAIQTQLSAHLTLCFGC